MNNNCQIRNKLLKVRSYKVFLLSLTCQEGTTLEMILLNSWTRDKSPMMALKTWCIRILILKEQKLLKGIINQSLTKLTWVRSLKKELQVIRIFHHLFLWIRLIIMEWDRLIGILGELVTTFRLKLLEFKSLMNTSQIVNKCLLIQEVLPRNKDKWGNKLQIWLVKLIIWSSPNWSPLPIILTFLIMKYLVIKQLLLMQFNLNWQRLDSNSQIII